MAEFMLRALVAGFVIALFAAPFGCFMVWRRIAFFGAAIAHAGLLGVAFAILFQLGATVGVLAVGIAVALILAWGGPKASVASDAMLGIVAHATLAAGLVVLAFLESTRIDLMAYLFGDILAVGWGDIFVVLAVGVPSLGGLLFLWRPLLATTLDEDLAAVDGVRVRAVNTAFLVLLALVIAIAIQLVGLLLVTALLIMPAVSARGFARTPETMAAIAVAVGMAAVGLGMAGAFEFDLPAGPSIVVAATGLLLLSWAGRIGPANSRRAAK